MLCFQPAAGDKKICGPSSRYGMLFQFEFPFVKSMLFISARRMQKNFEPDFLLVFRPSQECTPLSKLVFMPPAKFFFSQQPAFGRITTPQNGADLQITTPAFGRNLLLR